MPAVPKIIGDFMELMFSSKICKVNVVSNEMASSSVRIVTFKGNFPQVNFKIGQAIIIRINDTAYRNYTPSKWNSEAGTFEVVFHIHGNGPASHFVENLEPNDQVTVGMPRGFNLYRKEAKHQFFFGDESCISVFKSLKDEINRDGNKYSGILELDAASLEVPKSLGIEVETVSKSTSKAAFAIEALAQMDEIAWNSWKNGFFYLMGNAKSIQAFRKALKDKGVQSKNIYTKPFWADGKVGL